MPVRILIEVTSPAMAQAALAAIIHEQAEENTPAVLSDQAPSDIIQSSGSIESWVEEDPDPLPSTDQTELPLAVSEPKKRGRKPKTVAAVEDIEPSPEVLTEEEEAEAEGAVDTPEPSTPVAGITEDDLRKRVKAIMDTEGPAAASARLKEAGYRQVKEVPVEDYARVLALLDKAAA